MTIILATYDLHHFTFLPALLSNLQLPRNYGYAFNINFPAGSTVEKDDVLSLPNGTRLTAHEAYDAAVRRIEGLSVDDTNPDGTERVPMKWGEWPKEW
jgi:hypothetical protein